MILMLAVAALLAVMTWALLRVSHAAWRVWRESQDGALCLVVLATNWMRAEPLGWATAMRAEFACVSGRVARWRFALGCLRTALLSGRRGSSGLMLTVVMLSGLVGCLGLATYGRVRYPTAASGEYTALFVLFLAGGVWLAIRGNPAARPDTVLVCHYGVAGGLAVGLLFVVAVSPPANVGYAGLLGVGLPIAIAARTTRISGDLRSGVRVGIWVGLISGMVFFIGLMTLTYAAAGWFTYNAEAISVFNNFGPVTQHGHRLQQWPGFDRFLVRRESAVAVLFGFVVAPALGIASGVLGGLLGSRRRGESTTVAA
jgi:hypothetical protein